jgi:adenylyl- and sulfurtransferase ThiI
MVRIAERIARAKANALVTGEVVGQVASQTLENLAVIGEAATLPILRPLIGFRQGGDHGQDAIRLGTYRRRSCRTRTAARCSRRAIRRRARRRRGRRGRSGAGHG